MIMRENDQAIISDNSSDLDLFREPSFSETKNQKSAMIKQKAAQAKLNIVTSKFLNPEERRAMGNEESSTKTG